MEHDIKKDIYSYSLSELEAVLTGFGLPRFRAKQVYEWLHTHNAVSYDQMTNLPKALREQLAELFPLSGTELVEVACSCDGTRKYLLRFNDDVVVESVGIPSAKAEKALGQESYSAGDKDIDDKSRLTVCFSTQAGCGMRCSFCATGREGFCRNLSVQEMIDQIAAVQRDFNQRISNVVAMGQGEPFLNYDNLLEALRRLNTDEGFRIGARHITVSTCGIISGINRFSQEPEQFTLAISLHSALQDKRDALMPALSNQPLTELRTAVEDYITAKNRRVSFEYLMIDGLNDDEEDLEALIGFCSGLLCHVNLIPLNVTDHSLSPSKDTTITRWADQLERAYISTTIRKSKGADIAGACGQLKNASQKTAASL